MADDLTQAITDSAQQPKAASVDGVNVEQRPVEEMIRADQYAKAQKAASLPGFGIRLGRIVPPGSV